MCACLSPLVSYNNRLSKGLKLLDGTCILRNVESLFFCFFCFLLLPQSGSRPRKDETVMLQTRPERDGVVQGDGASKFSHFFPPEPSLVRRLME